MGNKSGQKTAYFGCHIWWNFSRRLVDGWVTYEVTNTLSTNSFFCLKNNNSNFNSLSLYFFQVCILALLAKSKYKRLVSPVLTMGRMAETLRSWYPILCNLSVNCCYILDAVPTSFWSWGQHADTRPLLITYGRLTLTTASRIPGVCCGCKLLLWL